MKINVSLEGVKELNAMTKEAAFILSRNITNAMSNTMRVVGQTATTKYMIPSARMKRETLKHLESRIYGLPTNPTKLTWRSGRLANSLVRFSTQGENAFSEDGGIRIDKMNGNIIGVLYTKVPYAKIHELGIGIKPRPFLSPTLKDASVKQGAMNLFRKAILDTIEELK